LLLNYILHVCEFKHTTRLNLLNLEARGKRLLELISLVGVSNTKGIEVAAAADLELGDITSLLDLDGFSVLAASRKEELLNFLNLLGLQKIKRKVVREKDQIRLLSLKMHNKISPARSLPTPIPDTIRTYVMAINLSSFVYRYTAER
jgi:hypothetical protein